jgi:hypothetical protein
VALELAVDPPDVVPLPELPELHPATAIEAVAATVQAASHRVFLSFIAFRPPSTDVPRKSRMHELYVRAKDVGGSLSVRVCTSPQASEDIQSH